jgi:hydroxypyruvate isomerase
MAATCQGTSSIVRTRPTRFAGSERQIYVFNSTFTTRQFVEGDLSVKLHEQMPGIGHIQVAGVPDRHELDEGELNYPYLFRLLDELGYGGWVGCEYRPRARTSAGLGWLRPWL